MPADTFPLIGSLDVGVSRDANWGPLSLRAGYGVWVTRDFLHRSHRFGYLSDEYINRVQTKIAGFIKGKIQVTQEEKEIDDDPGYLDWMLDVEKIADTLEEKAWEETPKKVDKFSGKEVVIYIEEFRRPSELRAAAKSIRDLSTKVEEIRSSISKIVRYHLKLKYPGKFYLVEHKGAIEAQYFPVRKSSPPPLFAVKDKKLLSILWKKSKVNNSYISSKAFRWIKNQIRLQVGDAPGVLVILRKGGKR